MTPVSTSASAQSPQFSQLARRFRVAIPTYGPKADENHKTRVEPRHASLYLHYCRIPHLRRNSPHLFRGVAGLDHNRRRHARVQRAEILVGAGLSEGEGKGDHRK